MAGVKEQVQSMNSARARADALTQARMRQKKHGPHFNIINLAGSNAAATEAKTRRPNTRAGYNIINFHALEQKDEDEVIPRAQTSTGRRSNNVNTKPRAFNVLTNKYLEDHETRTAKDHVTAKTIAEKKFWATHDYNLIAAEYYSKTKEDTYCAERLEASKIHGLDRVDRQHVLDVHEDQLLVLLFVVHTELDQSEDCRLGLVVELVDPVE